MPWWPMAIRKKDYLTITQYSSLKLQISEDFYHSTISKLRWYIAQLYYAVLTVKPNNTNNVTVKLDKRQVPQPALIFRAQ